MQHRSIDNDGGVAMFNELNSISLDDKHPCCVILSAPGECFDWALGMQGEPDETGERRLYFLVFDNKARAISPKQAITPQNMEQAESFRAASVRLSQLLPPHCLTQRGLGSTMVRNESLFVYLSTHKGDSYAKEALRTVVMRGQDTMDFFTAVYSVYEAMRASIDANITNVVKYV
jgi:hypothetical protein